MVIFGGLEILAAGYLVHQHHENKKERQRQEEEEEDHERRRAERHARRRERRDSRREKEKRADSAPPPRRRPSTEKYTYSSPQPTKAHPVARPSPAQPWVPPGPPPPVQYTPQPAVMSPRLPPRQAQSATPPLVPIAPPRIPPPPFTKPSQSATTLSSPPFVPVATQPLRQSPQLVPAGYNAAAPTYAPYSAPQASYSQPNLPPNMYEMSGGDVPQQYFYSSTHTPELRTPSPPIGERPRERPILRTGERRARSNSRVRFALPVDGADGRFVEVAPDAPTEMPVSPPPPYRP